jgi:hypothetical protein
MIDFVRTHRPNRHNHIVLPQSEQSKGLTVHILRDDSEPEVNSVFNIEIDFSALAAKQGKTAKDPRPAIAFAEKAANNLLDTISKKIEDHYTKGESNSLPVDYSVDLKNTPPNELSNNRLWARIQVENNHGLSDIEDLARHVCNVLGVAPSDLFAKEYAGKASSSRNSIKPSGRY